MDEAVRYCRGSDVVARRIAGEVLLVPVRKRLADLDCVYVLHGVGGFLWERLDGSRTESDLVRDIVERFAVEAQEAAADVAAFLGELLKSGLVKVAQV